MVSQTLVNIKQYLLSNIDAELLDSAEVFENYLREAASLLDYQSHEYSVHKFKPQGLSATLILSESHMAVHTWPENNSAYLVIATCRSTKNNELELLSNLTQTCLGGKIEVSDERHEDEMV